MPNSCFFESPMGFLTFVFGAQDSCFFFWQPRHLLLVHKTLVQVVWKPGEFPDICFWRPKHMFFFWDPSEFPDICCWCAKLMFLETPEDFLTFVLVLKSHAFLRAQWFSWHLFLVPKTHVFFLTAPTFAFGAQNSCTGCLRARRDSWHLFLVPKTHVFEIPASFLTFAKLMFLESPEGFLTFVLVPKIHVLF